MSFFEDASLVMIPSGIKDQKVYSVKPTDGSGDLTFSRGSDIEATRVASNGYIEKAKVNLLTYSNDFSNAAWVKSSAGTGTAASVTSGFSDPDGGSNAWRLQCDLNGGTTSSDQSLIYQLGSGTGVYAFSYYVKSNTGASQDFAFGNGLAGGNFETATATTSWQRFDAFFNCTANSNSFIGARGTMGTDDTLDILIYAAQRNYGLVAQEYQETTTTSVVSGITNDMPRLDYSGGASCPSLLLEPSRQNQLAHSEYYNGFSLGNSSVSTNYGSSPEGVNNATALIEDTANAEHTLGYTLSAANTTAYTTSVFVKPNGRTQVRFGFTAAGFASQSRAYFDIQEGTILSEPVANSARIEPYADGWYRISITNTTNASANISCILQTAVNENGSYQGDGTSGILVYGSTHELGTYPTSYIPTYGTSATRTADNTIINPSSLVGATQGSWFLELDDLSFDVTGTSVPTNWIGYNVSNCLAIEGRGTGPKNIYFVKEESNAVTTLATKEISTTLKACFVWNGTSLKCFVDGEKVYDAGGFTQPIAWSTFEFNSSGREAQQTLKQTLLFPTQISDADAIALTA